jgi:activator of HSP90 ATPase
MTKAIEQSVRFAAPPEELFEMYLDSKKHSAATGGLARVSRKTGGQFTAWNGQLRGRNLLVMPRAMVVQRWRSTQWKASDPDSILILTFRKVPGGGQVDLVHANVPDYDQDGVSEGWPTYYWKPWKKYLERRLRAPGARKH